MFQHDSIYTVDTLYTKCRRKLWIQFKFYKINHLSIKQKRILYNEWKFEKRKWHFISSYVRGKSPRFSDYNQIDFF